MKLVPFYGKSGKFFVGNLDPLGVGVFIDSGLDAQSLTSGGVADQIHDNLSTDQRVPSPIGGDMAEDSVLYLVPLAGAGWKVANLEGHLHFIGELLQFAPPQTYAVAIAPAAVRGNQQSAGLRIGLIPHLVPPAADALYRELGRVVVDPDIDPTGIGCQIIDTVGGNLAQCQQFSFQTHARRLLAYRRTAIPLPPEFVQPQDGKDKQDGELAASARWLARWGEHDRPWRITYLAACRT